MQIHTAPDTRTDTHTKTDDTSAQSPIQQADNDVADIQTFKPDVVRISPDGRSKAATEGALWESLHNLGSKEAQEESLEGVGDDAIDQAIQKIQEMIDELQQQIERVKDKDDEASKEQLENLNEQLLALNMQLMALTTKKLEKLKAEQG